MNNDLIEQKRKNESINNRISSILQQMNIK